MAERMTVHRDGKEIYDIVLAASFEQLGEEAAALGTEGHRLCIVTDSHVEPLYRKEVEACLAPRCRQTDTFVFPAGEAHKNLDTVRDGYRFLIENHYDRGDLLVALGGGVVGDLCGYLAATYLRGIRFIQIPTTLLSQVDSSIGGKTGVDFDAYKNMVGAFHMPALVYTNIATLTTLPPEQIACGMGEIIKHGLIRNREYYQWLRDHASEILSLDSQVCRTMIAESDRIKRDVVERDPMEKGERALLNFGHTLGHAIEKRMDLQLLHGQCVALGCLGAAYLSACRGLISFGEVEQLKQMMETFGLPTDLRGTDLTTDAVLATTKSDKKMDAGKIKFILLRRIGDAYVDRTVTDEEMRQALSWLGCRE